MAHMMKRNPINSIRISSFIFRIRLIIIMKVSSDVIEIIYYIIFIIYFIIIIHYYTLFCCDLNVEA